jgi:iron complex outermembrane receptor protein
MNCRLRKVTLGGVSIALGLGLTLPATAQESRTKSGSQSAAPETATSGGELGEIIVTARRVEERLQDVPISITVFNQDQLTNRNVFSARDLATYAPSLNANGRFGTDNTTFSIRGFSQENRTTASVGVYFADVVAPRGGGSAVPGGDGAGPGAFFDLQNVQILNGPQGTLFGRNTTGGAVLLVPQKPTTDLGGYVEESLGNYNLRRTQAVVNIPFSDAVRFRAGMDYNTREGYMHNTSGIGPTRFADVHYIAGRASLVVDITPNLENYTIGSYSLSDTNGQALRLFAYDPSLSHAYASFARDQLAANAAAGTDGPYEFQNPIPNPRTRTELWQVINTTSWTAFDALKVKNIVSYAELKNDLFSDLIGTNFVFPVGNVPFYAAASIPPPGGHSNYQYTATEELQFQGSLQDDRLVWQAGGYFESSRGIEPVGSAAPGTIHCDNIATLNCYDVFGFYTSLQNGLPPGSIQVGNVNWFASRLNFLNLAVYGQSTYKFTDRLKGTVGIRYTRDKTTSSEETAVRQFVDASPPTLTPQELNTPIIHCLNADSGHQFAEVVQSLAACRTAYSKTSSAPTWLVGLDYNLTDDVMVYGKYARAYRQGSIAPLSAQGFITYNPEKVDAYELGIKTSFYEPMHGTFNVSAFYNSLKNQQLLGIFLSDKITGNSGVINAGKSRISGVEVETTLVPFRGLTMAIDYAYLDTKLQEIEPIVLPPGSPYNLGGSVPSRVGDPLPYTAKNKVSATATYTLPLDASIGKVLAGATYSYQSGLFNTSAGPTGTVPAYSLVNFNLGWNSIAGSGLDAALFVTNAFDKVYRSGIAANWINFGHENEVVGEPRMYGGRIRYNFGR